jgi:hypothetical protein
MSSCGQPSGMRDGETRATLHTGTRPQATTWVVDQRTGEAFCENHMGIPLPQLALPTASPWLSSTTAIPSRSVKSRSACKRLRKPESSRSSSHGCAPAQTTPSRIEFHPFALMCATSASLNVMHELQFPAARHWALMTSLQTLSPETEGKYGGPFTTTFGPDRTTLAFVRATTNRRPSTRTARDAEDILMTPPAVQS